MDPRQAILRERIVETQKQRPGRRRYGKALKQEIIAYALEQCAQGIPGEEIARDLGLYRTVLLKWLRYARRMRRVGKIPFEPDSGPWTPSPDAEDTEPERRTQKGKQKLPAL